MALKIRPAWKLSAEFDKLNRLCDNSLNSILPQNYTIERRTAILLGRAPMFFRNSRPPSENGLWVISLARKIALLKDLESKSEEIKKIRSEVALRG